MGVKMEMDNNLDFNVLSERIIAQTEAYEKFAQSLARILELIDELKDKMKEQGDDSSGAFKELVRTITIISTQLESYVSFTKDSDALMVQHLADYNLIGQQLLIEIRKHQESVIALNETLEKLVDSGTLRHDELAKVFHQLSVDINALTAVSDKTATQIQVLYNNKSSWLDRIKGTRYYILAVLTLIGIIEALIQLGLLRIVWGGR
jgi:chromosome segregation ATPase